MLKGLRKCGIKFESFMGAKLDERSKILSDFYAVKTIQAEEKINNRLTKVVAIGLLMLKTLQNFSTSSWISEVKITTVLRYSGLLY